MFGTGASVAVVVDVVGASVVTAVPLPTSPGLVPSAAAVVEAHDFDVTWVDNGVVTAAAEVLVLDASEKTVVEGEAVVDGGTSRADVTDVSNRAAVEPVG
jgi:hypothetical protein